MGVITTRVAGAVVAVVGAGPRGLAVALQLAEGAATRGRVQVHLIDPHPGGRVWDPAQDAELLMNSRARQATVFSDDTVDAVLGTRDGVRGPSFAEWCTEVAPDLDLPVEQAREARTVGPEGFARRALFGRYTQWVVDRLRTGGVVVHSRRAIGLTELVDGTQELTLDDGSVLPVDHVVLALGHLPAAPAAAEVALAGFAREHRLVHVPPGPATAESLRAVPAGEPVAVLGAGLNFYDVMALLTQGRGGRFVRTTGGLRYERSGREPVLVVGSGRGVPYLARAVAPQPVSLEIVTDDVVARWCGADGTLSLRDDVWPLLVREMSRVWTANGGVGQFDLDALLDPFAGASGDVDALTERLRELLRTDLDSATAVPRGPRTAVAEALAVLKDRVRTVVAAGGFSRASVREDLQGWFRSAGAYVAAGPPALRVEQALALLDAGLLRSSGSGTTVTGEGARFVVRGRELTGRLAVQALVHARLPADDAGRSDDEFVASLLAQGFARLVDGGLESVRSRPADLGGDDATACRLVAADGSRSARRFVIGLPVQPQEWNIANLPQPGRGDRTIVQARSIAAQIARAAVPAPAAV